MLGEPGTKARRHEATAFLADIAATTQMDLQHGPRRRDCRKFRLWYARAFPVPIDRNGKVDTLIDAFSSREPASTSLENALILAGAARVGRALAGLDRADADRLQLTQPRLPFGLVDRVLAGRRRAFGPLQRVVIAAAFDGDDERGFAVLVGAGLSRPQLATATYASWSPNLAGPNPLTVKLSGQADLNPPTIDAAKLSGDTLGLAAAPFAPVTVIICVHSLTVSPFSTASRI